MENLLENIITDNFPNLGKETDIQVQETQSTNQKMKTNRFICSNSLCTGPKGRGEGEQSCWCSGWHGADHGPWASLRVPWHCQSIRMGYMVPFLVWSPGLETCGSPSHLVRQLVRHLVPSPQLWIIATS